MIDCATGFVIGLVIGFVGSTRSRVCCARDHFAASARGAGRRATADSTVLGTLHGSARSAATASVCARVPVTWAATVGVGASRSVVTAIAVAAVSVGGRGAAATSVMSEVTAVIFEATFEAISVMTFEATAVLAAEATADATVLAWRATAVLAAKAIADAMAAGKANAAAKTPRTRQRRTATATPPAFRSRPAGRKSSR